MSLTLMHLIRYLFRAAICNLESWLARRFIDTRENSVLFRPEGLSSSLLFDSLPLFLSCSILVLIISPLRLLGLTSLTWAKVSCMTSSGVIIPFWQRENGGRGGPLMATPIALTLGDGNGQVSANYGRISDVNSPFPFLLPPLPPPSFLAEGRVASGGRSRNY